MKGESVDKYLMRFKVKNDLCKYNKDDWPAAVCLEMHCNKFMFGNSMKERLLHKSNLNLTKAVEIAQRQESSKQHIKDMATKPSTNVNTLSCKKPKASDTLLWLL